MIPDLDGAESGIGTESSLDAIRRVVDAFERSDWSEIDVRVGDLRVHLAVGPPTPAPSARPDAAPRDHGDQPAATPDAAPRDHGDQPAAVVGTPRTEGATATATTAPSGAHVVVSPSPGIFWRSPEPGAPPFADVGDVVDESATVCIVEVMKLMNHVKAGVTGEVVAVYGDNGVSVRLGQPLFAIAPSGPPS